jgi:hypothetical protein
VGMTRRTMIFLSPCGAARPGVRLHTQRAQNAGAIDHAEMRLGAGWPPEPCFTNLIASAPRAGPVAQPGVPDARTVRVGVGVAPLGARHKARVTGIACAPSGAPRPAPVRRHPLATLRLDTAFRAFLPCLWHFRPSRSSPITEPERRRWVAADGARTGPPRPPRRRRGPRRAFSSAVGWRSVSRDKCLSRRAGAPAAHACAVGW